MTYRDFITNTSDVYVPLGFLRHKMKDKRPPVQSAPDKLDFDGCDAYWCNRVMGVIGNFVLALNIAEMREPRPEVDAFIEKYARRAALVCKQSMNGYKDSVGN